MKSIDGYDKLRGGYYTPKEITRFIAEWAIRSPSDRILEPGCGDGSFINAVCERLSDLGCPSESLPSQVLGVELDPVEAAIAARHPATIVNEDFFTTLQTNDIAIDVVVGNPPFIRYQNFNDKYRSIAFQLLSKHGFHPNKLTNIWLPFLLLSCVSLSPNGRIGMVVPAELFQVDYAAEARCFLSGFFSSLTLVTFKELVFDGIQQEVVLLLGERTEKKKGIRVLELEGIDSLLHKVGTVSDAADSNDLDQNSEKWIKYFLSNKELRLLKQLETDSRIVPTTQLFDVNVGLVSGENDFFVIDQDRVNKFGIEAYVEPIVSKADQVRGICFSMDNLSELIEKKRRVFLFNPDDKPFGELSTEEQNYIRWGEELGFNLNYKCRIRKRWYVVPKAWRPNAFLIRQANLYPKIIINNANTVVTDTLHKVRFREQVNDKAVAAAFLNTYTFALAETSGRSYGGGVLTFEPGEVRKLRIPMVGSDELDLIEIDKQQRDGDIEKILENTDEILLRKGLGLSNSEISILHSIWDKLRNRRLGRKKHRRTVKS